MDKYSEKVKWNKKDTRDSSIWQFIKFAIVGLSNTIMSLMVYYIFIWINEDLYLIGSFVGWVISVGNAFYWGNKFVFMSKDTAIKKGFIAII